MDYMEKYKNKSGGLNNVTDGNTPTLQPKMSAGGGSGTGGVTGYNAGDPTNNSASTDYYTLAKRQEYGKLLDSEVQLENAKANAIKYTNAAIQAQGFGGQGVGSSMNSSVYNKYLGAVNQAQSDYNTNLQTLDYQQQQEENLANENKFNNATVLMSKAQDLDSMNEMLGSYGYLVKDANGNYALPKQKPSNMTDDQWNQFKYYYNTKINDFNEMKANEGVNYFTSLDAFQKSTYTYDGKTYSIGNDYGEESKYIMAKINSNQLNYGAAIKVKNGQGHVIYIQYTKNGIRYIDEAQFNASNDKHSATWNNSKKKNKHVDWEDL